MKSGLVSFLSGVVFAIGLGISGMTQPAKIIGFLDFTGNWDPSLAFVVAGAITVHAIGYRLSRSRPSPLLASTFSVPTRTDLDLRLVGGAALFGLGWGIAGFCPGPALTSLVSGHPSVMIFVVAMIAGMSLYTLIEDRWLRRQVPAQGGGSPLTTPPSSAFQNPADS